MTMITPSYLGETIEYSSLHACRSTLEDPTRTLGAAVPDDGAQLFTTAGIVRSARGHDEGLLDGKAILKAPIGVVRCTRPGWDASALARSWSEDCAPIDAMVVRFTDEASIPDADFAARHDDEARLHWLAERLREALARSGRTFGALVVPPCLGVVRARARALSELVGLPCGEAVGLPGGPPGLRFEHARDRALAALDVERAQGRATEVAMSAAGWRVSLRERDGSSRVLEAGAVVLAMGGFIGGGLEYCPAESIFASALPPFATLPFRLGAQAPVRLGAHGSPIDLPSTLFGFAPESIAWPLAQDPLMDRVGVLVDETGRAEPGLYAAGDLLADRPRTWLDGLATGAAAGAAAAESLFSDRDPASPGEAFPTPP